MCGISGYFGKYILRDSLIYSTLEIMKNRGPDHRDFKRYSTGSNNIYLLSSRLKIVDRRNRSNQPMSSCGTTIVYNGEIYNIDEIRRKIKGKVDLRTKSDTELILHLYNLYGLKFTDYLDGMWSLAIFDRKKNTLLLSRDRIGEKPLYYMENKNGFFFGSETKFIRSLNQGFKSVNDKKVFQYLKYGYKTMENNNESFFKGIYKINSSENLILNSNFQKKIFKYWSLKLNEKKVSEKSAIEHVKNNFKKNIPIICNTNLKIGLSLSGGIDSNFLLGYMTKYLNYKIQTYSIIDDSKDKRYNEEDQINLGVNYNKVSNTKIYLSKIRGCFTKLKSLISYHDKPVSTISYFLQSLLYEKMKEDGIKVCISGNGADELFAGYYHHYNLYYNSLKSEKEKKKFKKNWTINLLPLIRNKNYKDLDKKKLSTHFTFFKNDFFLNQKIKKNKEFTFLKNKLKNKMLNELFFQTMPLALIEDDLNAMYNSIENRSPFLNKQLIETAFNTPTILLMKDSYNKYILRKCLKNLTHENIRLAREKKGFNASFDSIFSFRDKNFREWFFDDGSPIFNYVNRSKYLEKFSNQYEKGFPDLNQQCLFNVCSAKLFLENIQNQS